MVALALPMLAGAILMMAMHTCLAYYLGGRWEKAFP
jgi:hypothetical protein